MIDRLRQSGLIWPTVMTLIMLMVLIWLGNWQMQRLAWKDGLIARIDSRIKAEPISLRAAEAIWRKTGDVEYLRVKLRGRFMHDKERFYYAPSPSGAGWHVYTPLMTTKNRLLMVNRGFVPEAKKARKSRQNGLPGEAVEVVGLLRKPAEKGLFTPKNEIDNNIWYWRDLRNMVASVVNKTKVASYPFFLEVERQATKAGATARAKSQVLPRPGATRLSISNTHLQYAITWYGIALTLIGVFLAYSWSCLQQTKPED